MKNTIKRTVMGTAIALAAMGANAAELLLTPDPGVNLSNIAIDQQFNLAVKGTGFTKGLNLFKFQITWDSSVLELKTELFQIDDSIYELTKYTSASGRETTDWTNFGSSLSAGMLTIDYSNTALDLLDPFKSTITGPDIDFFSLAFKAVAASTSDVSTIDLLPDGGGFYDKNNEAYSSTQIQSTPINDLDVTYQSQTVTVNEVPLPAAVWLFGTGLLGLAGIARRRNPAEA